MELLLQVSKSVGMIVAAYALGCVATGYYLVRASMGRDIRTLGSGSAGSRNVGRTLGAPGFALAFLGDFLKGAIAVWAALFLGLNAWIVALVMVAVVAGHIWPAQLGFHGGKGLATAAGALLVLDFWVLATVVLVMAIAFAVLRQATPSGPVGAALAPGLAALLGHSREEVMGIALIALLILVAHRQDVRAVFAAARRPHGEGE
jgi:glycerol-3-phosphate acyltransferase PlsY